MEPENVPVASIPWDVEPHDQELVDDIKANGLLIPITLNAAEDVDVIDAIVDGRKRLAAAKFLGWSEIPAFRVRTLEEAAEALSLAHTSTPQYPFLSKPSNPFRLRELGLFLRRYAAKRTRDGRRRSVEEKEATRRTRPSARELYEKALGGFTRIDVLHRVFTEAERDPAALLVIKGWQSGTLTLSRGLSIMDGGGKGVILRGQIRNGTEQQAIIDNATQALTNIAASLNGLGPLDLSRFTDVERSISNMLRARGRVETITRTIQKSSGVGS